MMIKFIPRGVCRGISSVALMSGVALASTVAASAQTVDKSQGRVLLDEIVVTSTRRATTLQEVPASVVAFGSVQLEMQRIQDTSDLFQKIPGGMFVANTKTTSYVAMRGLFTYEDAPGADLPVAFFIDDVYLNGIVSNHVNMFDLDRVEVLRGPQGTLFGRNVVGGAVMLFSKRPSFETEFKARVGYGNRDTFEAAGVVGGTVVEEKLAGRLSFQTQRTDGGIYNETLQKPVERKNLYSFQGQLLYTPNEKTDVLFSLSGTHDTGSAYNLKLLTIGDMALVNSLNLSTDPFVNNLNFDPTYEQEIWTALLRVDTEMGLGTLTSITAYHSNDSFANRDVDAVPIPIIEVPEFVDNEQFTQEIRLATPSDKTLSAVIGAFYLNATNDRDEQQRYTLHAGTVLGDILGAGLRDTSQLQHIKVESIALFADATWNVTDQLSLQAGGRWTRDEKSGYTNVTGTPNVINGAPVASGPLSESWSAFTPRGVIRYEIDDQRSVYASVSRGFKGGGYTTGIGTVVGLSTPFDPEYAWNYELGLRSTWFDRRLLLNLTGFWMDVDDLQVRTFSTMGSSIVGNAGKVRSKGIEAELEAYLVDNLRIYTNYAYTDSKFRQAVISVDVSGNRVPLTPKHAIVSGFTYDIPAGENEVRLNMDITHKSAIQFNEQNNIPVAWTRRSRIDSLINASITYGAPDGNWDLSFWGKNLTNEAVVNTAVNLSTFYASGAEIGAGAMAGIANYNQPRSFGLTFTIRR